MAKKKTASPDSTPASGDGSTLTRKRTPKTATAHAMDRSPAAAGSSTTSEEVLLAASSGGMAPRESYPSYDEIARVAYERYLQRGGTHGQDFDDWLAAEQELQRRS